MVSPASACISVRACTYTLVAYSLICLRGSTVCGLLAETRSCFPFLMLTQNWYCSSSKCTWEWIHKWMTKCKNKSVCGASDLDKNQKWKKDGGDRLETLSLYSFFKHAGEGTLHWRVSKAQRGTALASKRGSPEHGSIYIHRTEPTSIWSLVWWLFKGCPESL